MRPDSVHTASLDVVELRALLGGHVAVAAAPLAAGLTDLLPEERRVVERAVMARVREFATGRVLARRLLQSLGFGEEPLLPGKDRFPRWPQGATGSISHAGGVCIVAVAHTSDVRAIGVDVEPFAPLDADVWEHVFVESESRWLAAQPASQRPFLARALFSAKECAYKCQYALTRRTLEFADVEVRLSVRDETFRARCSRALPGGLTLELADGTLCISDDRIVASMVLPA